MVFRTIGQIICYGLIFCSPFSVFAQEQSDEHNPEHHSSNHNSLTIGIASPYSFELETFGLNFRMYYNSGERICFGPEVAYFKNDDKEIVDFDFVLHYIFDTKWFGFYPLCGINYTVETEKQRNIENETFAEEGIVFGAGIHKNVDNFTFFIEYSQVEFGLDDQFLTLGVFYTFK
jgi:hypothetical protein